MKIPQQHVELVPSKLCDLLNITIILLKVVMKNLVWGKNWPRRTKIGSQNWQPKLVLPCKKMAHMHACCIHEYCRSSVCNR